MVAASTELPANPDTVPRSPPAGPRTEADIGAQGPIAWPQPALLDGPEQIGLFLVDEAGLIRGTSSASRGGALHLAVPTGKYLLSVEAWAPEKGLGWPHSTRKS